MQQSDEIIDALLRKMCKLRLEKYHRAEELASNVNSRNANMKVALVEQTTVSCFSCLIFPTLKRLVQLANIMK